MAWRLLFSGELFDISRKNEKKGCNHCIEVCKDFKISIPKDLSKAIHVLKENLADGTIVESKFWPRQYARCTTQTFTKIPEKAPWDDVLEYYFECPRCHQLFRLFVLPEFCTQITYTAS
jgi:hypothetical protein